MSGGITDSIISFYNTIFMQAMKNHVLQYSTVRAPSQVCTLSMLAVIYSTLDCKAVTVVTRKSDPGKRIFLKSVYIELYSL